MQLYHKFKKENNDVSLLGCLKEDIPKNTKEAYVLIVAIRDPRKIISRYEKNSTIVLNVGIHCKEGEIFDDVNFD